MKTALHYCAESSSLACADIVLSAAPDLVDARDEDGYTPIHLAVIAGNKPLIKFLLSKNADVNSLDYERHSVVHWATGKLMFADSFFWPNVSPQ
jgi:ankyrin repeat protein